MTSHAMDISTSPPSTTTSLADLINGSKNKSLENALITLIQNQIKNNLCFYCGKKLLPNAAVNNISSSSSTTPPIIYCPDCKITKYCSDEHQVGKHFFYGC